MNKWLMGVAIAAMTITALGILGGVLSFLVLMGAELSGTSPSVAKHAAWAGLASALFTAAGIFLLSWTSQKTKNLREIP